MYPFLRTLEKSGGLADLRGLAPSTVHDYIITTSKPLTRASRKHLVSGLRSFLRFAHVRGLLERSLVEAVPVILIRKLDRLPQTIPWDAVQKLLSMPDRATLIGKRDYAVLRLIASYGLRIGQAIHLGVRNIDWHQGLIHFPAEKGCKALSFPILKEVAEALLSYLRERGEAPGMEEVFLAVRGPQRPLSVNLQLRRSLGCQLRSAELALDLFDIYVAENFPGFQTVTRAMVTGYLKTISEVHLITRHRQLSVLRQFCRFLFQLNPESYIPEARLLPAPKSDFQPHIYTLSEVNDLMNAAQRLPPAGSLRPHTYSTLIGLLWASGLRGGEAVRLNLEDLDLERGVLHIRQTKNFKSRLGTAGRYHSCGFAGLPRHPFPPGNGPEPPVAIMNERNRRCAHRTVEGTFDC